MDETTFKGRVALITGGSRGIGRAITLKLASQGADVIINYMRRVQIAEQTAAEARAMGVHAHTIRANVGEPEKIDRMFDEIEEKFGRLDILVSNAASGVVRSALELESKAWDWTMDINARAFLLCAQRAARLMKDGGAMVAISSLGSRLVLPIYSAVGVSKAALEALTRYLAIELAPRGICVNGVAAGPVETESLRQYTGAMSLSAPSWQATPAGRMLQAEDVANVVSFLCGPGAAMIRGQIIVIDGGLSLVSPSYTAPQGQEGVSEQP